MMDFFNDDDSELKKRQEREWIRHEERESQNFNLIGIGFVLILISFIMDLFDRGSRDNSPMRGSKMIDGRRCYVARPEGMTPYQAWKANRKERKRNKGKRIKKAMPAKRTKLPKRTKMIDGKRHYIAQERPWWRK